MSLGALIAARVREWGAIDLAVERDVFGTSDPLQLAAAVDAGSGSSASTDWVGRLWPAPGGEATGSGRTG